MQHTQLQERPDASDTARQVNFDGFHHIPGGLDRTDIDRLIADCKAHFEQPDAIPSYVLIDKLKAAHVEKIKRQVEDAVGERVHYLNDFYIYTDENAQAHWHVDTEMFTFGRSYNAWILLSPDMAQSPLAVMRGKNDDASNYYHSMKVDGDTCRFANYKTAASTTETLASVEANKLPAPDISVGDILLLDPNKFHKTNIKAPKHAIALKFVAKGPNGFASEMQVPSVFWPETKVFNRFLKDAENWDLVVDHIRDGLTQEDTRKVLSGGFFPERLSLYKEKVAAL